MTQAILPTRLWGGSAEEKARRDELRVPMIDGNGRAFEDKWILSGTRLGDGSTRPQRRSNRLHPHLSRRAPVADTSVCPLRSDCLRVCRHRPGNGCSVRMQAHGRGDQTEGPALRVGAVAIQGSHLTGQQQTGD